MKTENTMTEEAIRGKEAFDKASPEEQEEYLQQHIDQFTQENILAFNLLKLKRLYPKAIEIFRQWTSERANMDLKMVDDDLLSGLLMYNTRSLYEFFDTQEICINITGMEDVWNNNISSQLFTSRVKAELSAFEVAFHDLNKK